jgi:hypothetical protein
MTWLVLAFNLLMLIWVIAGGASHVHNHCAGLTDQDCRAAGNAGKAIGVGLLIALWAAGDVILGVVFLVTRPRERTAQWAPPAVPKAKTQETSDS